MGKHGLGVVGRGCNATPRAKLEQKMGGCFGIRCAEVGGLPTQNLMAEQTFIIIFVQLFGPMYNVWLPGCWRKWDSGCGIAASTLSCSFWIWISVALQSHGPRFSSVCLMSVCLTFYFFNTPPLNIKGFQPLGSFSLNFFLYPSLVLPFCGLVSGPREKCRIRC